jgi:hypothetical protein
VLRDAVGVIADGFGTGPAGDAVEAGAAPLETQPMRITRRAARYIICLSMGTPENIRT